MRLENLRISSGVDSTLGILFEVERTPVKERSFICYVLEDQFNFPKKKAETRIPRGVYQIILRTVGGMHKRYKERFDFHQGMLWLIDVPGFEWIYIHVGNDDEDSEGCLLVGDEQRQNVTARGRIEDSVAAYTRLYKKILKEMERGEEVWIEIKDFA